MPKPEDWLRFALDDLKMAQAALRPDLMIVSASFYHAQQCAEKALKAYLHYHKQPIARTHDLVRLLKLCMHFDADAEVLLSQAITLNPYATATRYPDDYYIFPDVDVAHSVVRDAQTIFTFIEHKIAKKAY